MMCLCNRGFACHAEKPQAVLFRREFVCRGESFSGLLLLFFSAVGEPACQTGCLEHEPRLGGQELTDETLKVEIAVQTWTYEFLWPTLLRTCVPRSTTFVPHLILHTPPYTLAYIIIPTLWMLYTHFLIYMWLLRSTVVHFTNKL